MYIRKTVFDHDIEAQQTDACIGVVQYTQLLHIFLKMLCIFMIANFAGLLRCFALRNGQRCIFLVSANASEDS